MAFESDAPKSGAPLQPFVRCPTSTMTIDLFGKVLWPVWTAELLLSAAEWAFVNDQARLFLVVLYLFQPNPWGEPYLGFVTATVLFALAQQALFGLAGGWVVRAKSAPSA